MLDFDDLLSAFEAVGFGAAGEFSADINRATGKIYWDSDETDEELPDDIDDGTKYIAVPHKHDLDLGRTLVFEFVSEYIDDEYERVSAYFRRPGAYARFKDLLERRNLLDAWYEYERGKTEQALLQWLDENSLSYKPPTGKSAA